MTQMWPFGAMAIPLGSENWPLPVPSDPNFARYSPVGENSSTRSLSESVTHTSPFAAMAIPAGCLNWPLPVPSEPNCRM